MNKSALKTYAPQARRDFIDMVTSRAAQLGLADHKGVLMVDPCTVQGDVAIIAGQAFPAKYHGLRQQLINRLQRDGFAATMEAIAYTWFNRMAALRYMELQDGFLPHGVRVLSSSTPDGLPDILSHALELAGSGELPGISAELVGQLKLAGKDGELYKRLLVAQCNALSSAIPFLFERIDDETELLLPDNLLRSDSVVRKLVNSIEEADWQQVEVIGWLYQFYISEKKDQVIGKVVKSEDIPAATQLFTPNWIVKYLVQNSIGRLWLQANPGSTLASEWAYYIQPAEQSPEVQAELEQLIQTRIAEDGDTLNPESITVLDPACGSGHILVEAYDLLKAIYQERGYRLRDIPRLILEKNLYGLDIDDRAAQLAGFALLMKARADDRRLFDETPKLNVHALQDSHQLDTAALADTILASALQQVGSNGGDLFGGGSSQQQHSSGITSHDLRELIDFFAYGKTFGSLLTLPAALANKLPKLAALLEQVAQDINSTGGNSAAEVIQHFLRPAQALAAHYDGVIANPPYMGGKGMNAPVKEFAKKNFPDSKSDLFAMFIERGFDWCKSSGFNSMVTMQSWMFLSSYEAMREKLLSERTLSNMVHMGNGVMGIAFGTAASVFWGKHVRDYEGSFSYCESDDVNENGAPREFPARNERLKNAKPDDFKKIPGNPIAYWAETGIKNAFFKNMSLSTQATPKQGLATGDNNKFLRNWSEVSFHKINFNILSYKESISEKITWVPYSKGGGERKWFGFNDHIVFWKNGGEQIKNFKDENGNERSRFRGYDYYFQNAATWGLVTSGNFSCRYRNNGFVFDIGGMSLFSENNQSLYFLIGFLNSKIASKMLKIINPTLNFQAGDIGRLPIPSKTNNKEHIAALVEKCIAISRQDWDLSETSWNFKFHPFIELKRNNIKSSWNEHNKERKKYLTELRLLEEEINQEFIESYELQDELSPEVPEEQIILTRADREKDMQRLVSYATGCMMGRYSLDEPGLIYAHSGNEGFNPVRYATFPADSDGIVPVSDMAWFADDATSRVIEFVETVWGKETLAENLAWLAESLGQKADESPEEALRRYIAGSFFKDHCQTYKKRPIYWLFSSGKQKAFEALVYLHRYNEGTLSRMRAEYVVPLTGKMAERIKLLEDDADKASSAPARKAIDKEITKLKKKLEELRLYDEKLRHYADMRISLDLDDGVKVNYGKFGDLLDGVKAITGGNGDE
ncbi:BREX-1 system adenine-specific DNA-methyltransferase PglX [Aquitalea sp. USM4]|uniref:BREX-1 system adenine-specific DNA-methyltransferase PglX n=1 Tax=Aquitalea sp. USM4 TaxID=1590041 RepID=UPI00103F2299|nr:BREX-1 system adenine-specific DNA-methyltransferase PglX [Aquitalea sp. USM4]QBJ76911.1 BREX-1 system adenine-specific DNA-methyltransferase PglX [Aquitalea sp. USM4]